ncbi:MAG: oxygen-independent coproporphyrinogen III oxidase [Steroidobacteraceae bacterium]
MFDSALLRRYDQPGPRYTSYPTAPQFREGFGAAQRRMAALHSNEDPIPRQLSLYVHVPFCTSPCFYCGCNRVITRDRSRAAPYVARVIREAAMLAPLFDRDRKVVQLHFGGGTPNFLDVGQLAELIDSLEQLFNFSRSPLRDFSIELDPRCVDAAGIAAMAQAGLNRVSLGVQDFDPDVQQAVNRVQSVGQTLAVIEACRRHGMRAVNVDLIYGLPKQTPERFARTLDQVLAARPDRVAVYGYAHLPQTFRPQRQIRAADLPGADARIALLALTIERLTGAGYRHIGMDHFALPDDDLAVAQTRGDLHRNFMGYTTHAECDLVGLGVSAISQLGDSYSQNPRDLPQWETQVDDGRLPCWRGLQLDDDDRLRAWIIQRILCEGEVSIAALEDRFKIDFARYFSADLARLQALAQDRLVELGDGYIRATARGRLLLRVVCACFDRYLHHECPAPGRFSSMV